MYRNGKSSHPNQSCTVNTRVVEDRGVFVVGINRLNPQTLIFTPKSRFGRVSGYSLRVNIPSTVNSTILFGRPSKTSRERFTTGMLFGEILSLEMMFCPRTAQYSFSH